MTKYIFVTGGVVSGLGKGITAASPGTMSPYQHGEVLRGALTQSTHGTEKARSLRTAGLLFYFVIQRDRRFHPKAT